MILNCMSMVCQSMIDAVTWCRGAVDAAVVDILAPSSMSWPQFIIYLVTSGHCTSIGGIIYIRRMVEAVVHRRDMP